MNRNIYSNSQSGQDFWVIQALNGKRDGFFMEIGGGDGLWISNTLVMERELGWTGILVEPTSAYDRLVKNRTCICDNSCISSEVREVTIHEIHDKGQSGISDAAMSNTLLSTVTVSEDEQATVSARWGELKGTSRRQTITLEMLLERHNAPRIIDYFSLDVEGHEYEILKNFPFDQYRFRIIGVERPPPELHELLLGAGYRAATRCGEDVMYVNPEVGPGGG